jgi:hypothetical protein
MKKLTVLTIVILFAIACNNATEKESAGPDTTSGLPAPATVDTSSLQPDTAKVEKALRK